MKADPSPYLQQYDTLGEALRVKISPPSPDPILTIAPMRKGIATESPCSAKNISNKKAIITRAEQKAYSNLIKVSATYLNTKYTSNVL